MPEPIEAHCARYAGDSRPLIIDGMNPSLMFRGSALGLTTKERQGLSLHGLVRSMVQRTSEWRRYAELSAAVAKRLNVTAPLDILVPADLLFGNPSERAMSTSAGSKGGYMVDTVVDFGNAFAKRSVVANLPLSDMGDLVDNVAIAETAVQHSTAWVTPGVPATPNDGSLGAVSMEPKTCVVIVTFSRQLVVQAGPVGRRAVDKQLGIALAEGIDAALLAGTGAAQPLGIFSIPGTDTRVGGSFALADAAGMLKVAEGYANDDSVLWVAGVDAAEVLRKRPKVSGGEVMLLGDDGRMLGHRVLVSRSCPAAKLCVAAWSQVWAGSWGALQVAVDESDNYFNSRQIRVRLTAMVDFAAERPGQVAIATGVA